MEIPTPNVASPTLLALGEFLLAALRLSPETEPLAAVFQPAQDKLAATAEATRAAERALIPARVALGFAERQLEVAIRAVGFAAQSVDGQRGGKVFASLFPRGLAPELRPRAQAQLDAAVALVARLDAQTLAAPVRAERGARLGTAVEVMKKALADRATVIDGVGTARAREMAAREDFTRQYDSIAGELKVLFPRDRSHQDLFFDAVRNRASRPSDDGEPVDPGTDPQT